MKSLCFLCLLLVLYGMAVSLVIEYSFVAQSMDWTTAQNYCRQHYGDLAIITTEEENQRAVKVIGQNSVYAWIGLYRIAPHVNAWKWSNGKEVNFTKWNHGEPDDQGSGEDCAVMNSNGWYDISCGGNFASICRRSFVLVKEKKTWDEALKYCRTHYTDLTSVDSGTLLDMLKTETQQAQTASVWTGLRFLDGQWFWVNGVPLGSLVSLPSCPVQPYHCGAYNFNTKVWENRDCNEKLHFLC
ncbi:macrophage mannose receptor 1-like [Ictalurus furcatus]|uniref:macrophage mannose receptor 1-like n=1 Tax=Ictalurus furcatus TaxID=66913 RepID=UPI00235098E3|nr:macrophage mannose receptor 1-like [Ictalurus furcatus]